MHRAILVSSIIFCSLASTAITARSWSASADCVPNERRQASPAESEPEAVASFEAVKSSSSSEKSAHERLFSVLGCLSLGSLSLVPLAPVGSFEVPRIPAASPPSEHYPWRKNIVTTTFWAGESATRRNPVPNRSSCWDPAWAHNYGGTDDPEPSGRAQYLPAKFTPRQNPFYFALPYNDVEHGATKPEAAKVIPWFKQAFRCSGQSVLKDRWIAIRYCGRVVYAQWEDAGPFRTDHWEYVFGQARPKKNLNKGAGLDVSPAVRDFLRMNDSDVTDWRFVDFSEVPVGPWAQHGENNTFVRNARRAGRRIMAAGITQGLTR